jgi:methylmalonyl-CoA/ethylmalonyl-CoA epimerase
MSVTVESMESVVAEIHSQDGRDPARANLRGPLWVGKGILHHLGYVVPSISIAAEIFAASISARWDGKVIHDPIQGVRVAFFSPADVRNPVFELVEPASDNSPVSYFLRKRGGGLHHICYEIDGLDAGLREAKGVGFCVVATPQPAVAFDGRRIAWINRNRMLIELLERERS